jgi:hypothetical protein
MKWIRSRASRPAEPPGQQCTGCRTTIPGAAEEELRAAGGVFLASVGWFCGVKCERQYRLRFRIQPATTPADGSQAASKPSRTPTPNPAALVTDPPEAPSSGRRSAADELTAAIRARRRQLNNGV